MQAYHFPLFTLDIKGHHRSSVSQLLIDLCSCKRLSQDSEELSTSLQNISVGFRDIVHDSTESETQSESGEQECNKT